MSGACGGGQATPDSLQAVLDSVFAGPAYRWFERPDPFAVMRRWLLEISRWLGELRENHPVGFRLVLAGVIVVLIGILVHAGWVLLRTIRPAPERAGQPAAFLSRRDRVWYLNEANRLAAEGRFVEAMQIDFLALILALDETKVVAFHPAKTPREYVSEPALPPSARARLRELVRALYGYAFARWPCGPGEFSAWRERLALEDDAATH